MKTTTVLGILTLVSILATPSCGSAQPVSAAASPPQSSTAWAVTGRGADHKVWQRQTVERAPNGALVTQNHKYCELASGMHYRRAGQSDWLETSEKLDILPGGMTAAATNGPHQVFLPADIYEGAIELVGPDGVRQQSRPLCIGYYDGAKIVFLGELTNSSAQLLRSGNQVLWTNCFTGGIQADVLATYRRFGFECDVVLRSKLPAPELFGMSPNCRLQIFTEFLSDREPRVTPSGVSDKDGTGDVTIEFGAMRIGRGKAFSLPDALQQSAKDGAARAATSKPSERIPVRKSWVTLEGRTFLIEDIPLSRIQKQLDELSAVAPTERPDLALRPERRPARLGRASLLSVPSPVGLHQAKTNEVQTAQYQDQSEAAIIRNAQVLSRPEIGAPFKLPAYRPPASRSAVPFQLAQANAAPPGGFVIDYIEFNSGPGTNYTFRGDTTYYISGYCSFDNVTLEGGTVIKYAPGVEASVDAWGKIICQTSPYRPAILAARDTDEVGEILPGSAGSPSGYYASAALVAQTGPSILKNIRCEHAEYGVVLLGTNTVQNCQFLNTWRPICAEGPTEVGNVLFSQVDAVFDGWMNPCNAFHLSIYNAGLLMAGEFPLAITNSLFVNVTNWGGSFTGANNATNSGASGVFQAVGAAGAFPARYGVNILPATSSSLALDPVSAANAGNNRAVASRLGGGIPSTTAMMATTCAEMPSGLVGWWRGETDAEDTLHAHDGSLQGAACITQSGVVGNAFQFDGTNSFVVVPDARPLRPAMFTVEAWVWLDSQGLEGTYGEENIVYKRNSAPPIDGCQEGYWLYKQGLGEDARFKFVMTPPSGLFDDRISLTSLDAVNTQQWYHLAAVRGSNYVELYVNGDLHATASIDFPSDYGDFPLLFGSTTPGDWQNCLHGKLDEIALFDRALGSNEIAAIYQAGAYGKCPPARSISLLCPVEGAGYYAPASVSFRASSYSPGVITNIAFYDGSNCLGSTTLIARGLIGFTWTNPPAGSHAIKAIACDGQGTFESQTVNITVTAAASFLMGVNLNGSNAVVDGCVLTNYTAALAQGLSLSPWTTTGTTNDIASFIPSADTDTQAMLQSFAARERLSAPDLQEGGNQAWFTTAANYWNYQFSDAVLAVTFSNVPPGWLILSNTTYRAWPCTNEPPHPYDEVTGAASLIYTYGPHTQSFRFPNVNWNPLNYIINHKFAANMVEVEKALWTLMGVPLPEYWTPTTNYARMTNDAILYGQNFVPGPDQAALVLCETTNSEQCPFLIEVDRTDASRKSCGFTLTQTNLPNADYYVSVWLAQNQSNCLRSLDLKVQDRLVAVDIGSDLEFGHWAKYGGYGASVTNGTLTVEVISPVKGAPVLMGLAIYGEASASAAPSVQILSPTNNQFFLLSPTNILISVNATAESGTISQVSLLTNGVLLGQADWKTNSTYEYLWQNAQPATNWTLSAIATDSYGASATNSTQLAINAMPMVSIFAPTNLQSYAVPANVTLSATAWDAEGTIVSVEFYCPTGMVGTASMTNGTNYNFTWNGLAPGTYFVTAQATDDRGAQSHSEIAVFQVLPTNLPPVVSIIWPTNGATFPAGANITILATATNTGAGTVTNVEFFADTRLMGSDPAAPYSLTECCWKPGVYQLRARAVNDQGASGFSEAVEITVGEQKPGSGEGFWDAAFGATLQNVIRDNQVLWKGPGKMAADSEGNVYFGTMNYELMFQWTGGTNWEFLPNSLQPNQVRSAMLADGTNIYAWSSYNLCQYTGSGFTNLGNTLSFDNFPFPEVKALALIGGDFYIGGTFLLSNEGSTQHVARLNPTLNTWEAVGGGLNREVAAVAALGNEIYIGGAFTNAGVAGDVSYIARLDGNNWVPVGGGLNGEVWTLAVCGSNLFAGGCFTTAGGDTNASGVAVWNGRIWRGLDGGVEAVYDSDGYGPRVVTLAARGDTLFAGGRFSHVLNGTNLVFAHNVAKCVWSEAEQTWRWSGLDEGVFNGETGGHVSECAILQDPASSAYDLIVVGDFTSAGSGRIKSCEVARWCVRTAEPAGTLTIVITNPVSGTWFSNAPSVLPISATAHSDTNLSWVDFYADGQYLATDWDPSDDVFNTDWNNPPPGVHLLTAAVEDTNGLRAKSASVVVNFPDPASGITASNDQFVVMVNSGPAELDVLANDTTASGCPLRLLQSGHIRGGVGGVSVAHDQKRLIYSPNANTYGSDILAYSVTDGLGTNTAWVTVLVRPKPVVSIEEPFVGDRFGTSSNVVLTGRAFSYDHNVSVTNVALLTNGMFHAQTTNTQFSFSWSNAAPGYYTFEATALDNEGLVSTSAPVTIVLTNAGTQSAEAIIANLDVTNASAYGIDSTAYPVIREGFFDLVGTASGDSPVAYQLLLFRPEDLDWGLSDDANVLVPLATPFADLTTGTKNYQGFHIGSVSNGVLGRLDLAGIPNGIYDLLLRVRGGTAETNAIVRVRLDSELKIGQFSFSEQDLSIPVNGIPITVIRAYNSLSVQGSRFGSSSSFGPGWTYALSSMDVQLDEVREEFQVGGNDNSVPWADDEEEANGLPKVVSIRTGGSWDVTLTLPDGRRATFAFKPRILGSSGKAYAEWEAPPGVHATLKANSDSDEIYFFPSTHWESSDLTFGSSPIENQDISGWILETQDGTKYHITRGNPNNLVYQDPDNPGHYLSVRAYGTPKLTEIEQRSGDRIVISDTGVSHYNTNGLTRSVFLERDSAGRITALYDPNSGLTNNPPIQQSIYPAVRYIYNRDTGNLIQVQRLQDRTVGNYLTTKYHYNNPNFPYFITSIEDPRGIPLARNEYDDQGRLTGIVDANGNRTQIIHNTASHVEMTIDALGRTNVLAYDLRGNVTASTNALGGARLMGYDINNNKTNEVVYLNGQPYATNRWTFSPEGFVLGTVDPLGHSNVFTYNEYGQALTSTDVRGSTSTNVYDPSSGNLLSTTDAAGNTTTFAYTATGLLTSTTDPMGNVTTNYFDSVGNTIATAMLAADGTLLSSNSCVYDQNGNRLSQTARRTLANGSLAQETTRYTFDAQNHVTQTVTPDGATNTVVYNELGKVARTVDPLGRVTTFEHDWLGRSTRTTYPDGASESSGYDAAGNRTSGTNRLGEVTGYRFDGLNRLTGTTFADGATNGTVFDSLGRVSQTRDALGVVTATGHDAAGRAVVRTNAAGIAGQQSVTRNIFDPAGNLAAGVDNLGRTNFHFYDALNRRTNTLFPDGTCIVTVFDPAGRRVAETDQATNTTRLGHDGMGRLIAVTNALGQVTRYGYDEAGNQVAQVDANNHTNTFEYDSMGRRTRHTLPGGQFESFAYDLAGNQVSHTDFKGLTITNEFDSMNRLMRRRNGASLLEEYTYDAAGRMTRRVDGSGTYTWVYDCRGRVTTNTTPAGTLCYQHDRNGNLTNCYSLTPNGVWVSYQHDALNRVTNVVDHRLPGANSTICRFDGVGNLDGLSYPNGVTNHCSYDLLNRLTNLTWKLNTTTIGDFSYLLGAAGNRLSLAETVNGANRNYAWAYDKLYRLTNETISLTAPAGGIAYGLDAVGNRTNRASTVAGVANQSATFDANDRLSNDSYDSNGNTTNSTGIGYQYNYANQIIIANGGAVQMAYGADGMRVRKTAGGVTTLYLVAAVNPTGYPQVLEELTVSGGVTNLTRAYTYGLGLISQREADGAVYFFGADGHGSTRFLCDTNGAVVNTFAFDAYGVMLASNAPPQTAYLYTGQEWDNELGFYYLDVRYYKTEAGRFWTMDSFNGRHEDPLSLHKYLYAANNPVNLRDPSGHEYTYVSIGSTMTLMIELELMHLHASANATRKAQMISGSVNPDFNDLIWGLEAADIIMDKVQLAMAAYGMTYATVKVAAFLSENAYSFGNATVRTLNELREFASHPSAYRSYTEVRNAIKEAGMSTVFDSHHLLAKVFAPKLGLNPDEIMAVPLVKNAHTNKGGGGINIYQQTVQALKDMQTTVSGASVEQIWKAHKSVYEAMGHPEWAKALHEAYFKSNGIAY